MGDGGVWTGDGREGGLTGRPGSAGSCSKGSVSTQGRPPLHAQLSFVPGSHTDRRSHPNKDGARSSSRQEGQRLREHPTPD